MILQYFKIKENEYKKIADKLYIEILLKSKKIVKKDFFNETNFNSSFELISIILILYLKVIKDYKSIKYNKINDELIKNFIQDLDDSLRENGIGDMSIGKYVKKYVKKFYYRIKIIDPILNYNEKTVFIKFLKSLKIIKDSHILEISEDLLDIYNKLKHNKTKILL